MNKEKKYRTINNVHRTVNNVLGITDEREHEICEKLDEIGDRMFTKTGGVNVATMIQEIEEWDSSFNRIEKSYAIFMVGEAVGRKRAKNEVPDPHVPQYLFKKQR